MKDVNIKFHAALLCSLLCAIFWGCCGDDDKKDYIAEKSGHTRGSTIDLTIFKYATDSCMVIIYKFLHRGTKA